MIDPTPRHARTQVSLAPQLVDRSTVPPSPAVEPGQTQCGLPQRNPTAASSLRRKIVCTPYPFPSTPLRSSQPYLRRSLLCPLSTPRQSRSSPHNNGRLFHHFDMRNESKPVRSWEPEPTMRCCRRVRSSCRQRADASPVPQSGEQIATVGVVAQPLRHGSLVHRKRGFSSC